MTLDRSRPQTVVAPPRTINVQKFAESRASELETLHSIIKNRLNNDFRSQRSKRRRTTGHDNRLTKNRHKKKRKVGNNDVGKTESLENDKEAPRRVRRRIELRMNPNSGFLTSRDGTKRLRTHIWHAKRFTMAELWGFYLPLGLQGRGRGSRAILKKLKDSVLVHDASYTSVVQLEGPGDILLSILDNMIVSSSLSQCENASQDILSGAICGNAMLHHYGVPFSSAITPVTYMWQRQNFHGINAKVSNVDDCEGQNKVDDFASSRKLWILIHASALKEGFEALQSACKQQINASTCTVSCINLEDRLAKLEVIGSKTLQVLKKMLHPAFCSVENSSLLNKCSLTGCDSESQFVKIFEEDQIPSFGVVPLTVVDPRAFTKGGIPNAPDINALGTRAYKEHEIKVHGLVENPKEECKSLSSQCLQFEECCDSSQCMDLWHVDKELSPPVEESVLCTDRHNQRMELFRLGDRISEAPHTPNNMRFPRSCPLLLIKNYGQKSSIKRWSIILPLSWVKVFWICLITNGAYAIGLREKQWVACEAGLPYFPSDFPDCNSYSSFMEMEAAAADEKLEKTPPFMRPFGVPILPPWNSVHLALDKRSFVERNYQVQCEDVCTKERNKKSSVDYSDSGTRNPDADNHCSASLVGFIARTSYILSQFLDKINGSHLLLFPKFSNGKERISKFIKDEKMLNDHTDEVIYRVNYGPKLCFIRVLLQAYSKGFFEGGAVVCAPHVNDILLWTQRLGNSDEELQITESSVRSYFAQQADGKWECQLPTDPSSTESYRMPIGFVTTGFVQGSKKPIALGLCEAINLACLREDQWRDPSIKRRKEIYVLVRNLRSTAYRLAMANIILEQREDDIEYM